MTTENPNRHQYLKNISEKAKLTAAISDPALTDLTVHLANLHEQTGRLITSIDKKQDILSSDDIHHNPCLRDGFAGTKTILSKVRTLLTDFATGYEEIQTAYPAPGKKRRINLITPSAPRNCFVIIPDEPDDGTLQELKSLKAVLQCILEDSSEKGADQCNCTR